MRLIEQILTTEQIALLAAFAGAANPDTITFTGNGAIAGNYPVIDYSTPAYSTGSVSMSSGDINCCILNQITDFLVTSHCCTECSHEELAKMLFFNDISTVIAYDIVDEVLSISQKNELLAFTGCLYCPTVFPSTSTGAFAGGLINSTCCSSSEGGGDGSVTSISLSFLDASVSSIFDVNGGNSATITDSGTFTVTLNTQAANTVFAGPVSGSAAIPTFRAFNFYELADTFTYPGNAFAFPMVNSTETALIPVSLFFGSNLVTVDMVTTGNITLSGIQNLDSQTGVAGSKVLVWQQTSKTENGVWIQAAGAWSRATDSDTTAELNNQVVFANYTHPPSSIYGGAYFNQVTTSPTIGVDNVVYELGVIAGGRAAWKLDGNTVGSIKWIGTIDEFAFPIRTFNTERARFFSTGEFGIGITASPLARFHVRGTGTTNATFNFRIENNDASTSFALRDDGWLFRNGSAYSVSSTTSNANTTWGISTGNNISGGTANTLIGYTAGQGLTAANSVTMVGAYPSVATANGTGTSAFGSAALQNATGTYNTGIGTSAGRANTSGQFNLYIGAYADVNDSSTTLSNLTGNYNIVMGGIDGTSSTAFVGGNAFSSVWAVHGVGTTSNQIVFGGGISSTYYTDFYLGAGVTNTTVRDITIHATSGSGSNIAGANLKYAVGQGTGTGIAGDHIFYMAPIGSSGSSLNALVETFKIKGTDGSIYRYGVLWSRESAGAGAILTTWGYNAGGSVSASTNESSMIGYAAGASLVSGNGMTAVGAYALNVATTSSNTGLGSYAGRNHTTGHSCTYLGFSAGYPAGAGDNATGNYNTAIGTYALVGGNFDNVLSITGVGTASNQIQLGGATNLNNAAVCFYTSLNITYSVGLAKHSTYYRTSTPESAQTGNPGDWAYVNDGAGNGSAYIKATGTATNTGWVVIGTGAAGANTALSNLASVSINASLIPQTTLDLGATTTAWRSIYFYGSGTYGSHSFQLTGTPTGHRVVTFIDATQTVVNTTSAQTFLTGVKLFNSSILAVRNPGDTFTYTIAGAAIAADRILTLPLTTGTDSLCAAGIDNAFTVSQSITGNIACSTQGRFTGSTATATLPYRTTNGGSNVNAPWISGQSAASAGNLACAFDATNSFTLLHSNGTRHIAGAGLALTNLDNTAGSEDSDLIILTQSGGSAMTQKMRISSLGNIVAGAESALATTATDGDFYVPSCAGVPTGVPSGYTGKIAVRADSTNNKLYIYSGGNWVALN